MLINYFVWSIEECIDILWISEVAEVWISFWFLSFSEHLVFHKKLERYNLYAKAIHRKGILCESIGLVFYRYVYRCKIQHTFLWSKKTILDPSLKRVDNNLSKINEFMIQPLCVFPFTNFFAMSIKALRGWGIK